MREQDEFQKRLADLMDGPWMATGNLARKYLAPRTNVISLAKSDQTLNIFSIAKRLKPLDIKRQEKLRHILRWHEDPIRSKQERNLRDSLDFALTYLLLLELAIETGYIPLESVKEIVRREIFSLLWSRGAQEFIRLYDYVGVEYLAARVGIEGFRAVTPPPVNRNASIRFAAFLSQLTTWVEDKHMSEWRRFLDDYVEYPQEQTVFMKFLEQGGMSPPKRFQRLLLGIHLFIFSLSDLFEILEQEERGHFGLFYSYWMAKFFNWRLTDEGYVQNRGRSWAKVIAASPALISPSLEHDEQDYRHQQHSLKKKIATIEVAWKATRELVTTKSLVHG
jgi:hypothetical protein